MYRYLFFLISILIIIPSGAFSKESLPIDVKVVSTEGHQINKKVFGVNGALLWSPIRYNDPTLSNFYNDLGLNFIRIPGGTDANYYLWHTANYGCNTNRTASAVSQDRIKKFNTALSRHNRTYTTEDFVSFLKRVDTDFSLVINVLCDTPDNARLWVQKWLNDGVKVKYIELGNELYNDEYEWGVKNAEEYLQIAKKHAEEIRRIVPDARIGLVASSSSFRSKYFPDLAEMAKHEHDRKGLAFDRSAAAASFADAIVIHIYSTVGVTRFESFFSRLDYDKAYQNAISHFDSRIQPCLQYLHNLNPNKRIWITEWGIAFYDWLRPYESGFVSSYYNALYVMNNLLTFSLVPYVDATNYHNFPNLWSYSKEPQPNTTYKAFQILKEPMDLTKFVCPVDFKGEKKYLGSHPDFKELNSELAGAFFYSVNNGYLVILNKLGTPYSIRSLTDVSGSDIHPAELLQIVPAQKPASSEFSVINKKLKQGDVIEIPPYSITRILVENLSSGFGKLVNNFN